MTWMATTTGNVFRPGVHRFSIPLYARLSDSVQRYACLFAICCGVAGAVVGMAETYYTGPIALLVAKPFGGRCSGPPKSASSLKLTPGDLGFELSAAFSGVIYPLARYLEISYHGR